MEKANRVHERLTRAKELYEAAFSGFQRNVLDSHKITNVMRIYFMVKMSRELENAETFLYLKEAVKVYSETFPSSSRMLDDDPISNIITIAQYMMEAKEPTRKTVSTTQAIAKLMHETD